MEGTSQHQACSEDPLGEPWYGSGRGTTHQGTHNTQPLLTAAARLLAISTCGCSTFPHNILLIQSFLTQPPVYGGDCPRAGHTVHNRCHRCDRYAVVDFGHELVTAIHTPLAWSNQRPSVEEFATALSGTSLSVDKVRLGCGVWVRTFSQASSNVKSQRWLGGALTCAAILPICIVCKLDGKQGLYLLICISPTCCPHSCLLSRGGPVSLLDVHPDPAVHHGQKRHHKDGGLLQ